MGSDQRPDPIKAAVVLILAEFGFYNDEQAMM